MTLQEIYECFDRVGCVVFSTRDGDGIESRIAHFFAWDDEGLYLRTMCTKPFYRQLKQYGRLSVCGMYPVTQVTHDADNLPSFQPGYTIRVAGEVRELSMTEVERKAEHDRNFNVAVHDIKNIRPPASLCCTRPRANFMTTTSPANAWTTNWNAVVSLTAERRSRSRG